MAARPVREPVGDRTNWTHSTDTMRHPDLVDRAPHATRAGPPGGETDGREQRRRSPPLARGSGLIGIGIALQLLIGYFHLAPVVIVPAPSVQVFWLV